MNYISVLRCNLLWWAPRVWRFKVWKLMVCVALALYALLVSELKTQSWLHTPTIHRRSTLTDIHTLRKSSGQSSWIQIFWEVVGLERGPLSLVSTREELFGRNRSDSGLESRAYVRRGKSRWPRGTLLSAKFGTNFAEIGGRSVGIVRSRTQDTEFFFYRRSTWGLIFG
jgi:hypothetical protein